MNKVFVIVKNIAIIMFVSCFVVGTVHAAAAEKNISLAMNVTLDDATTGSKNVELAWNVDGFVDPNFVVMQKALGRWNPRSSKYSGVVRVLNVYPKLEKPNLVRDWMDNLNGTGNGTINVDPVYILDFNASPASYLKDSSGKYKYDVIVFGFWDANNSNKDLSATSRDEVDKFLQSGGGVLFGHDTVYIFNPNFAALGEKYLNMKVMPPWIIPRIQTNQIRVAQNGTLTRYPYAISDSVLNIPVSHTSGQIPLNSNNIWIKFEIPNASTTEISGKTYDANSYLTINGNAAFIQSGHSSGATSVDEQKIIANTIFDLAQLSISGRLQDIVMDYKSPSQPVIDTYAATVGTLTFSATDIGDTVSYRVVAKESAASAATADKIIDALDSASAYGNYSFSNTVSIDVTAGIKGFVYTIDEKTDTSPLHSDTLLAVSKTNGAAGSADLVIPNYVTDAMFLHIAAIDKNDNVGQPRHISMSQYMCDVKVFYVNNADHSEIAMPSTIKFNVGEKYQATPLDIDGYSFLRAEPPVLSVSPNEANNVITVYYGEILSKEITGIKVDEQGNYMGDLFQKTVSAVQGVGISGVRLPLYPDWKPQEYAVGTSGTMYHITNIVVDIPFTTSDPLYVYYESIECAPSTYNLVVNHISIDHDDNKSPVIDTEEFSQVPVGQTTNITESPTALTGGYVYHHIEAVGNAADFLNGQSFAPTSDGNHIINIYYNKMSKVDVYYVSMETKQITRQIQFSTVQNVPLTDSFISSADFSHDIFKWDKVFADKTDISDRVAHTLSVGKSNFVPVDDFYVIYVLYKTKTYTLNVKLQNEKTGAEIGQFSYENVPITDATFIADPHPNGYEYVSAIVPTNQLSVNVDAHSVKPCDNGDAETYTVILNYKAIPASPQIPSRSQDRERSDAREQEFLKPTQDYDIFDIPTKVTNDNMSMGR